MINGILIIAVILIFVTLALIYRVNALADVNKEPEHEREGLANKVNAYLMVLTGIVGMAFFFWYSLTSMDEYMMPTASSIHGVVTDKLFWFTTWILIVAFVITHVLIIWFIAKYHYKKGREVAFFAENHKLELIWTVIPAIVLTILIFRGFKTWTEITSPEMKEGTEGVVLEIVGEQFKWSIRYPGEDEALGAHDFRKITAVNPLGIDLSDVNGVDDILAQEIHLPVNTPVLFRIRAKDVLHSVFAPHFRVKMDAVPGMPTQFMFTPTITTEEMRTKLDNPKFTYELACTEICGKSHYKMKNKIIVHTKEEYKEWLASQTAWSLSKKDGGYEVKQNVLESVEEKDLEAFNKRTKALGATTKEETVEAVVVEEPSDSIEVVL